MKDKMEIDKIRKVNLKTEFVSARVKPENKKWFKDNKIDLDLLIEELRNQPKKPWEDVKRINKKLGNTRGLKSN